MILDPELVQKAGVVSTGSEKGTFAGGKGADVGQGRLVSLILGDFVVRNLPVAIQSTRRFAAAARGKRVDGILGTVLISHQFFRPYAVTLHFERMRLVLRWEAGAEGGGAPRVASAFYQ